MPVIATLLRYARDDLFRHIGLPAPRHSPEFTTDRPGLALQLRG
jgi:hypothetical protein